ncbi:MAG TPA: o-succinylbenzoate--CoA ligase [Chloroflexota bacterium]|jgi:O-succinylbenzoic acid--CoA ligase|nr:o-succinylbenzoate--CoA ligase [Chloroflexota bacterium]
MSRETANWLLARSKATPDRTAFVCGDESVNYKEFQARVDDVAGQLAERGVNAGDRIGLMAEGMEFAIGLYAASRLGAVSVPLNLRLRPTDLAGQMRLTRAQSLVSGIPLKSSAEALMRNMTTAPAMPAASMSDGDSSGTKGTELAYAALFRQVPVDNQKPETRNQKRGPQRGCLLDQVSMDDLHSIVFTSGTTRRGKGVRLTYQNHWWNAIGSSLNLGSKHEDVWLDCLPLYHVGGLSILIRGVLYGVPVIIQPQFDPVAVNAAIDSGACTIVSLVSTMLYRVLTARAGRPFPSSLRCVLLGGGPLPPSLLDDCVTGGVPVGPTYGMTETASQAATLRPDELVEHLGSAGRPLLGVELRIETAAGEPPDARGEILVRGLSVTPGYEDGQPSASAGATGRRTVDGWLRTGDIGWVDGDGYLEVSGRRVDLIVTGGENVHPSEVESVLVLRSDVEEAAVVGIPDAEWGQIVCAVIVPRGNPDLAEVARFCRERLAPYKCPRRFYLAGSLPRTSSGKLLRIPLREQVEAGNLVDSTALT